MKKLIALFGLLFALPANAIIPPSDRQSIPVYPSLLEGYNPGFENGLAGWTISSAPTVTRVTSGSTSIHKGTAVFDASASGQYIEKCRPVGDLHDSPVQASFWALTTATDYLLKVTDGTNLIASITIPAVSVAQEIGFVAQAPASGNVCIRVESQSDAAAISLDDAKISKPSTIQASQASFIGEATIATTSGCTLTRTNAALGAFGTQANCPGPTVGINPGPGLIQTTDADLPRFTVANLPAGYYEVMVDADVYSGTDGSTSVVAINESVSATTSGHVSVNTPSNRGHSATMLGYFYFTTAATRIFEVYCSASSGSCNIVNEGGSSGGIHFSIKRYPLSVETARIIDTINWKVDANIGGANPGLGSSNVSSYTGIENATLDLVNNPGLGNISAQVPCSSTNPPTGLTCAAGNESIGVSFVLPAAQDVEACVSFSHALDNGASGNVSTAFQIVETPNNAQTISQLGNRRLNSENANSNIGVFHPITLCGTFSFSSAGQKTLRLFYEQTASGTLNLNAILADRDANTGQRDIHWYVHPTQQQVPAPVVVNSVTNRSNTQYALEASEVSCLSAGSTVNRTSTSGWLSIGNRSGSACALTLSGFVSTPFCTASTNSGTAAALAIVSNSPTSVTLTNASAADFAAQLLCYGAR